MANAVDRFARDLGRLVTENGAALDMVSVAEVHLTFDRTVNGGVHPIRGHITARARIVDDRGREYADTFVHPILCVGVRWDAL